jgi:hypothetical protein
VETSAPGSARAVRVLPPVACTRSPTMCVRESRVCARQAQGCALLLTQPATSGVSSPPPILPPCRQVDQNDTRTQLHYAIMLRDKMAPQKVRAGVCGVAGGGLGVVV